MRLSNDRYRRDLRSFNLAHRMLWQEARTCTISLWAALSPERVRRLSLLERRETHPRRLSRHRGPAPTSVAGVLTSPSLRREGAVLAGFCRMLQVIPEVHLANAAVALPSIGRGERLCSSLELLQLLVPHTRISLDQLELLVQSLAEGAEWEIDGCARCATLIVFDRLGVERALCEDCEHRAERRRTREPDEAPRQEGGHSADCEDASHQGEQLDLFNGAQDSDDSG